MGICTRVTAVAVADIAATMVAYFLATLGGSEVIAPLPSYAYSTSSATVLHSSLFAIPPWYVKITPLVGRKNLSRGRFVFVNHEANRRVRHNLRAFPQPRYRNFRARHRSVVRDRLVRVLNPVRGTPFVKNMSVRRHFSLPYAKITIVIVTTRRVQDNVRLNNVNHVHRFSIGNMLLNTAKVNFIVHANRFALRMPIRLTRDNVIRMRTHGQVDQFQLRFTNSNHAQSAPLLVLVGAPCVRVTIKCKLLRHLRRLLVLTTRVLRRVDRSLANHRHGRINLLHLHVNVGVGLIRGSLLNVITTRRHTIKRHRKTNGLRWPLRRRQIRTSSTVRVIVANSIPSLAHGVDSTKGVKDRVSIQMIHNRLNKRRVTFFHHRCTHNFVLTRRAVPEQVTRHTRTSFTYVSNRHNPHD